MGYGKMTDNEELKKKLRQVKHRKEEVEARNRMKAEKQRTHRLIQMGAILGSIYPAAWTMDLEDLKLELRSRFYMRQ